ncbi:DUF624 domain-containing protein [uncultured Ruminococcus sp.]|uniref:YesL family protein n=1 Tax=uncultured Ruminococcus sp. TaxID=165186 RepID=UPI0025E267FD|nr:DUF624 domain-containing protein [uncultured Ruminococcus sp.]
MGIFFKDYVSAGSGIAKNAPKKKGAALFFDILGRKFWKLLALNFIYMLFFLPFLLILFALAIFKNNYNGFVISTVALLVIFAVLIGPATAGMTKVIKAFVIEKHTFIWRDFWGAFKSNFKNAAIVGFIDCLVLASAFASFQVYPAIAIQTGSKIMYVPMVIAFSLFLVILIMNYYIFPMMIATTLSLKNLLKNSFALAFVALKQNFIIFIVSLLTLAIMGVFLFFVFPVFMLLLPFFPAAFLCLFSCFISYPVIQKYVINPYYTSIGEINPELIDDTPDEDERIFEDMGGKEKPIEKRSKGKGKRIS